MNPQSPAAPQPTVPQNQALPPQPTVPAAPNDANQPNQFQLNPAYGHDKLAVASLILGIVALPASIFSLFTLPIPITAIVLGSISIKRKKSFALAGIILGVIGIILSAVVLIVGAKLEEKKNAGGTTSTGSNSSLVTSNCYEFPLPEKYSRTDIKKNSDCATTLIKSDSTDDLSVSSYPLPSTVNDSNKDKYLKAVADELENLTGDSATVKINSRDYTNVGGERAYIMTGDENYLKYKYVGFMVTIAPKEYTSVSGKKLRTFIITYDSATSKDRLEKLAKTWTWK